MDISHILEFVILAETENFSAAAYRLHTSQATLSRHIQSMERELGYELFIRSTRSVELSEYGQIYLPYAKRIAENARKADAAMALHEKKRNVKTKIGITHYPNLFMLTELISGFCHEYPEIPLQIYESSLTNLRKSFSDGQLRIITTSYPEWKEPPREFILAGKSQISAILPKDHPLSQQDKISLNDLEKNHLIVPDQSTFIYQYLQHTLQNNGIHPDIVYEGNATGIEHLLKGGFGIIIQDTLIANSLLNEHLVIRKIDPPISYIFGLEYRKNLTKNERTFVNYIRRQLEG